MPFGLGYWRGLYRECPELRQGRRGGAAEHACGRRAIGCAGGGSPPTGRRSWHLRGCTSSISRGRKSDCGDVVAPRVPSALVLVEVWPVHTHLQGGPAGADIEEGQGTRRCRKVFAVAARTAGRGMTTRPEDRDPQRVWRRLRENPDYVADWRASAGPTAREAPPLAFRRQTEADLEAARWKLLAWENPHRPQWAELFRADVAMVEARVAAPGPSGKYSWRRLVLSAGATYTGLRLLDGALVLKVRQGRDTEQLRVVDGAAFDPELNGLETAMRRGARARRGWVLVKSLDGIVLRR